MPLPKKERIWHDPPMPGEANPIVSDDSTATLNRSLFDAAVNKRALELTRTNMYLVIAFYAFMYSSFWYVMIKYLAVGATTEDVFMASMVIPGMNIVLWLYEKIRNK
jgi:hypothetical protein